MELSIKKKALKGAVWSSAERFSVQGVSFLVMLIMARILNPTDYGLVGMLTIFIAISQALIDCGFSQALIRKKDRSEVDNSTVFYFNIVIGVVIYLILYSVAPLISDFYNEPILINITRIISLSIILNSFGVVQRAIFTVNLDFKSQAKASFIAAIIAGIIGILLAYRGAGVWAIVIYQLVNTFINVLILWVLSDWRPQFLYSWSSFHKLFGFGSKLAISSILSTIYDNLYLIVIGKIYRPTELGYYTRAFQFAYFPSTNVTQITQRVMFPILCKYQEDDNQLIQSYLPFLKAVSVIVFPSMCMLIGLANTLIPAILGSQWAGASILLQIISLSLMWYPLHSLNNSLLQVKGRTDLVLKVDVIKKIIGIIFIIAFAPLGVAMLCLGNFFSTLFATAIHLYYTNKVIGLGWFTQIKSISYVFFCSVVTGVISYLVSTNLTLVSTNLNNEWTKLILGGISGIVIFLLMTYWTKSFGIKGLLNTFRNTSNG